jgi:hypothetical protein
MRAIRDRSLITGEGGREAAGGNEKLDAKIDKIDKIMVF